MTHSQKLLSDIIIYSKYARYLPHLKRRENWDEIVDRTINMHIKKFPELESEIRENFEYVRRKEVLPSMRSMQFAGEAIERMNTRMFNCYYMPIVDIKSFGEIMYLLMGGTGVGYSVQHHHINNLPKIISYEDLAYKTNKEYFIEDTIEGWCNALTILLESFTNIDGYKPIFNFSLIRPKGSILKTSGGRAPGPEPLDNCFMNIYNILLVASGRYLTSLEVHDIVCHIANTIVSGGIRRSACICLFDAGDTRMLTCKSTKKKVLDVYNNKNLDTKSKVFVNIEGEVRNFDINESDLIKIEGELFVPYYAYAPQRGRANNSVVLDKKKTSLKDYRNLLQYIVDGEPGILWTNNVDMGINPCSEYSLYPYQFCNTTTQNNDLIDSQEKLNKFAEVQAFIGTLQATYTSFKYLRSDVTIANVCARLLGLSCTGIASGAAEKFNKREAIKKARRLNSKLARKLGIAAADRLSGIKPEGTASLVLGTSSGIHPYFSKYYIRRIQLNKEEPIYKYLTGVLNSAVENNIISSVEASYILEDYWEGNNTAVLNFPMKAPEGAVIDEDIKSMLNRILDYNKNWIKPGHLKGANKNNVSATVIVKPEDKKFIESWVWRNRKKYTAISFFPEYNGHYKHAPHEAISEDEFINLSRIFDCLEFNLNDIVEEEDSTELTGAMACSGGSCELINI